MTETFLCAPPADAAATRAALEAEYEKYSRAFKDQDLKVMASLLAPDFILEMPDGQKADRRQTVAMLREHRAGLKTVHSLTITIEKLSVHGDVTTAVIQEVASAIAADAGGNSSAVVSRESYRETWTKGRSGWKMIHALLLSSEVTRDGKLQP